MSASSLRGSLSHFVFLSSIDPRRSSPLTFPPSLSLVPYIFLPLPNLFSSLPAFSSFLARSTDRARPFSCCHCTSTSSHFFPRTSSLFFSFFLFSHFPSHVSLLSSLSLPLFSPPPSWLLCPRRRFNYRRIRRISVEGKRKKFGIFWHCANPPQ